MVAETRREKQAGDPQRHSDMGIVEACLYHVREDSSAVDKCEMQTLELLNYSPRQPDKRAASGDVCSQRWSLQPDTGN